MKKRIWMLVCLMLWCALLTGLAEEYPQVTAGIADMSKYGNVTLDLSATQMLDLGYTYGDMVQVTLGENNYPMPLVSNYADVDSGEMLLRAVQTAEEDVVIVAINRGDFATTIGLGTKQDVDNAQGFEWTYDEAAEFTISMLAKGAYYDDWNARQVVSSNVREDYPQLTDEEFANFRAITTTGMGEGVVYRSSSPVNGDIGRNTYADAAAKAAGICTALNLADTLIGAQEYEGYQDSYYATLDIIPLNMGVNVTDPEFLQKMVQGLKELPTYPAPYLVHCNEGKDRAGFVSAVLELLMGAPLEEVEADFMVTFANYYGVEPGSQQYQSILNSNLLRPFQQLFGVEDLAGDVDLAGLTQKLLLDNGMTQEEITALQTALRGA